MTLGHVVLGTTPTALALTRAHERVHVSQCERWGPLFLPAYAMASLWALLRNADPYRDNRFEREAFAVANPADGRPGRPGQLSAATGNEPPSPPPVPPQATRIRTARVIAMVADLMQLVFFPAFAGGWVSPLNDALDIVVALLMVRLVGWHLAFLPTLVAELVPGLDLIPTWTAAVWFASRHGARPPR